jgi:hypothetical protein
MVSLLLAILVDALLVVPGQAAPEGPRSRAQPPRHYTLTASCAGSCTGRFVTLMGAGYFPPSDLGTYHICVNGDHEYSVQVSADREITTTTPWTECRSIGVARVP